MSDIDPTSPHRDPLDKRRNAYRDDLAADGLREQVEAKRFVAGKRHQVIRAAIGLRREPEPTAGLDSEALFGETINVFDTSGGWAWGQLERDGYVGYLPAEALNRPKPSSRRIAFRRWEPSSTPGPTSSRRR